jgi:Cof subfamily protein (haloacid dehalogenase superfamily)
MSPPAHVVATDLDGTLLRQDLTVSDFTRAELVRLRDSGRRLAFVTGRPPRWMAPVIATTAHTGTAVCANGAAIVELETETVIARHSFDEGIVDEVIRIVIAEMGADVRFGVEVAPVGPVDASDLVHEPGFLPPELERRTAPLTRMSRRDDVVKILARGSGPVSETTEIAATLAQALEPMVAVSHASKTHQLLEIAPAGVTKATGLAWLVEGWGANPEQVVAFGDMPNDIPMLTWAGWGVAVESAHPLVLAMADEVVPDADRDGVATWLRDHCG